MRHGGKMKSATRRGNGKSWVRRCDGVTRRDAVRLGVLSGLGLGVSASSGAGAAAAEGPRGKAKACILLWLDGGPSHLETFDLKPEAPAEVRGPFRPIQTSVVGMEFCELLGQTAKVADKLAVIRSMTSPLGEHGLANHYLMTGYKPSPALQYPSIGSVVAKLRPADGVLPPYVAIPEARSAGAGFLGPGAEPFVTGGDPGREDFKVRDLEFYPEVDVARLERRREFLSQFDRMRSAVESSESSESSVDPLFDRAYRMLVSPQAKSAFDLKAEPDAIREMYGMRGFGQSCLLARRLVERGVPFVTVTNPGWDTHESLVLQMKLGYSGAKVGVGLIPTFDQAFAALVSDLDQRGMLDETLVIAMGEFGRTPKLNTRGGRDHWPRVFSVVLAGGGVPGGQVIGASDRVGESPREDAVTPNDLARTVYTLLGINPDHELVTPDGRPIHVNQGGRLIRQLT